MNIQIVSDIHINYNKKNKKTDFIRNTDSDIIVLAGNIGCGFKQESEFAAEIAQSHQKPVIIVTGNHSYFGHNLYNMQKSWRDAEIDGVNYLDNTKNFVHNGVNFVGGCLWVDYSRKTLCMVAKMKEYTEISVSRRGLFTPDIATYQHILLKEHIKNNVLEDHKNVIVTHFPPSYQSCDEQYKKYPISCHFATEMDEFVEKMGAEAWVHGHSQLSYDYKIGETRIVANPLSDESISGSKNNDFDNKFCIDV